MTNTITDARTRKYRTRLHSIQTQRSRASAAALAALLALTTALAPAPGHAEVVTEPTEADPVVGTVAGRSAVAAAVTPVRTIRTSPFKRSRISMQDNEGSAYVRRDHSLWLADDEAQRIYEVNPSTGRLKRIIGARSFSSVRRLGGVSTAGIARSRDLESIAYDEAADRLYVFSGNDCKPSNASCQRRSIPTVFSLRRVNGRLQPGSFQPLPRRFQASAAAWNPGSRRLLVGEGSTIRAYRYDRNRFSAPIQVPGLTDILGMDFSGNGKRLYVVRDGALLSQVDWAARSLNWTLGLSPYGVRDARGVEMVRRKLYVSDGYDFRPQRSRLRYAVLVFDVSSG